MTTCPGLFVFVLDGSRTVAGSSAVLPALLPFFMVLEQIERLFTLPLMG